MAKDKERALNPAQQQRKLEKTKALKKGKADLQARRTEKLAHRNPERLQRQVDDLKASEESGQIKPREKQILEQLERDVRAIRKARDSLGDKAPPLGHRADSTRAQGRDGTALGKRSWDGQRKSGGKADRYQSAGSDTDESVRRIPMPKDTPPPIPQSPRRDKRATGANTEPIQGDRQRHELPEKPSVVTAPKTTYESAPHIRDLKKEAVGRFVPNAVRRKQEVVKGTASLVEPEVLDQLEREGYAIGGRADSRHHDSTFSVDGSEPAGPLPVTDDEDLQRLAEEERRFQHELRQAQVEEVEDDGL